MRQKSISFLILKTFLYYLIYNLACTFFIIATVSMIGLNVYRIFLCVFYLLGMYFMVFVTAKRDGERDHNLLKYEHISRINKYKWLKIGFIIVLLTIIPELFLIINKLKIIEGNLLLLYAFLNGVKYPLVLIMAKNLLISQITFFMIFILISCCLPLPAVGYFGYYSGYKLIDIKSKIMYE